MENSTPALGINPHILHFEKQYREIESRSVVYLHPLCSKAFAVFPIHNLVMLEKTGALGGGWRYCKL